MLRRFDFECAAGHVFERTVTADEPEEVCECGERADIRWLRFPGTVNGGTAQRFEPVVVFKNRDGSYSFPGRSSDPTPMGMQRVELTTVNQIRRFEAEENSRIKRKAEESLEREDRRFSPIKNQRRNILRQQMQGSMPFQSVDRDTKNQGKTTRRFTEQGRKFAEFAMEQSNKRPSLSHQATKFDAGFRIEAFSMDKSNRAPHNDVDTGMKDKY